MITVFTPSYNRKKELVALYDSLLKQDRDIFEWLIVDDGSTDDTKKYVDSLISENKININYCYKKNGGKQSAYNKGLDLAKGNIFLCIDSDDILKENILSQIIKDFKKIEVDNNIGGIAYVQNYINNKDMVIGSNFPNDNEIVNYFDIYHKLGVTGDKLIVLKTTVAKEFYFPMIEKEKFVPEALVFNRISKKYNFVVKNNVAAFKEYIDGGYSSNYFNLVKRNPIGNMLYYKELYELEKSIYNIYGYLLFGIFGKIKFKELIKNHSSKFMIIIMYPFVYMISIIRK